MFLHRLFDYPIASLTTGMYDVISPVWGSISNCYMVLKKTRVGRCMMVQYLIHARFLSPSGMIWNFFFQILK